MDSIIPPDDTPLKRCTTCRQEWPATPAYFNKHRGHKDGFASQCKKCRGKGTTFGKIKEMRPDEKQCTVCLQWFPKNADSFHGNKDHNDGFSTRCRECDKEIKRVRHAALDEADKEKHRENMHQYYKTHREEVCYANRKYYARHKEEVYQYKKRYYAKRGYHGFGTSQRNYRARQKAVQGTHTAAQIAEQLKRQHYRCYYAACGFAKFKKKKNGKYDYHVEHTYPVTRIAGTDIPGNDMSYLVLACGPCNSSKHNKYPWEWPEGGRLL